MDNNVNYKVPDHWIAQKLPGATPIPEAEYKSWQALKKEEARARDANPKTGAARNKPPLSLVPPVLEIATSFAFKDGAEKYGPYNWRETGVAATVYIEAAKRHLNRFLDGSNHADDSGVHELAHAAACIAIILDAASVNKLIDDRPKPGASNDLIEKREAGQLQLLRTT